MKFEKTHSLLQGRNLTTRYKGKRFLCALNFSQFTLDNLCTKLQNVKAKNPKKIAPLKILKIAATNFLANLCCHMSVIPLQHVKQCTENASPNTLHVFSNFSVFSTKPKSGPGDLMTKSDQNISPSLT